VEDAVMYNICSDYLLLLSNLVIIMVIFKTITDDDAGEDVDLEDLQSEDEIQLEEEETEIDHTEGK
jgi:hypothetical protein